MTTATNAGTDRRPAHRAARESADRSRERLGGTVSTPHDGAQPASTSLPQAYVSVPPSTIGRLRMLKVGPVELNLDGMAVRIAGRVVHMAPKEFELLALLMQNAGRLLTRRQLLDAVWGEGYPDTNKTLEVHIRRLRKHLECDPDAFARMRTVRGVGYVFDLDT